MITEQSNAGRHPHQYLDGGETRPQGQPRRSQPAWRPRRGGTLQQATAPRSGKARRASIARRANPTNFLQDHAAMVR